MNLILPNDRGVSDLVAAVVGVYFLLAFGAITLLQPWYAHRLGVLF